MIALLRSAVVILVSLSSCSANAAEETRSGEVWINAGSVSWHPDRDAKFNERNFGLGLEYKLDERYALVGGVYRNSVHCITRYAGVAYTPIQFGPVRLGALAGLADGYPEMRDGRVAPVFAPVMTIEGKRVGINFMFVPPVSSNVSTAFAMQLKLRLGV